MRPGGIVGAGKYRGGGRFRPRLLELEDRRLPSTWTVTSTADDGGSGTLRTEIGLAEQAGGIETIDFSSAFDSAPQTIVLGEGALELKPGGTIDIVGPGAGLLTVNANHSSRVFEVNPGVNATISGLTITGGSATIGGGVYARGYASLAGCTITGNTATYGGGVYGSSTLTLTGCTISGNSGYIGGGLYTEGTATLTGCAIGGNSAGEDGGGVYNSGKASITDCTVSGNSATKYGGGLWNDATATLTGCTVSGNSAGRYGGGACLDQGTASLAGCTLSGNSSYMGGGLFNFRNVAAYLTDCTLSGNSATHGGALFNYGDATLTACTVSGNGAIQVGGIYNYYGNSYDAEATLTDTIVAGNTSGSPSTSDIGGDNASAVTGTYDLIGTGGWGGITGGSGGDIVLTSLFGLGLAPLGDYGGPTQTMALLTGSRAIGKGIAVPGVTVDQRGFALDSPVDIGAFQATTLPIIVGVATDGAGAPSGELDLRGAIDLAAPPALRLLDRLRFDGLRHGEDRHADGRPAGAAR